MENDETTPAPKSRFRNVLRKLTARQIAVLAGILVVFGLGAYGASWYNSQKYVLVVEATQFRVAKGRMLPWGDRPFLPSNPDLRKAYRTAPLPSGMKLPRGRTVFFDRVQLDQALYRLLKDATDFSLAQDNARTSELTEQYLAQIDALPGLNVQQQTSVMQLRREVGYIEAKNELDRARTLLQSAEAKFWEASKGAGRYADGGAKATAIARVLTILESVAPRRESVESGSPETTAPPVPSSNTAPHVTPASPARSAEADAPVATTTTTSTTSW